MRSFSTLRLIIGAVAFGAISVPAGACTLVAPSSAAEAARWRQGEVNWHADRIAKFSADAEVIFFGLVTASRPTDMSEQLGGQLRLGWPEVPAFRIWVSPESIVKGEVRTDFSVYWGTFGDNCRMWGGFKEGEIALVLAGRPYLGGHWFGEVVGGRDLEDLLPALKRRGLRLPETPR